jgi:hypothetical protein
MRCYSARQGLPRPRTRLSLPGRHRRQVKSILNVQGRPNQKHEVGELRSSEIKCSRN